MAISDVTLKTKGIDNLDDVLYKKRYEGLLRKNRINRERVKEARETEKLEKTNYFAQQEEVSGEELAKGMQHLDNPVQNLSNIYQKIVGSSRDAEEINFKLQYLIAEDLEFLFNIIEDNSVKKRQINELIDRIELSAEGGEFEEITKFLSRSSNNIGETYLMICYILEVLRQRRAKKKLQQRLQELIKKYESENSEYLLVWSNLSNFFNKDQASVKFFDGLAKLSSGTLSVNNLKQVLYFIRDTFDGDFTNLISTYMKVRASQIKLLTHNDKLQFEERNKFIELIRTEKYLLVVNSMYQRSKIFINELLNNEFAVKENYHDLLWQILTLTESSYISELSINNLSKSIIVGDISDSQYIGLLKRLVNLLRKMPNEIYQGGNKDVQKKIFEGIHNILINKNKQLTNTTQSYSLLKKKSKLLEFV